ncbi:MAG: glycosyltransferase family 2 protein [Candidatus Bathyarchaeia archaeon]
MKVSVVIPTYYRVEELSELFNSLLNETVKPFEVIVVDDTPDDTIRALCETYKAAFENVGSELIYIKNSRMRSLTISRNLGVKLARGELIMFLDSDVVLYPDYVEKICHVFMNYPALGVQGWIVPNKDKSKLDFFSQILNKLFFLDRSSKNSCKFHEYPSVLTKIINCERLSGANMTYKREVFNEFAFDENMKKYCYMEDVLFSYLIYKKHPKGLFITPYAKCVHKESKTARMEDQELKEIKNRHRKYVLIKLFGLKGWFLYYWQGIGIKIKTMGKTFLNLFRRGEVT